MYGHAHCPECNLKADLQACTCLLLNSRSSPVDSGFRIGKRTAYTLLALAVGTIILVGLIVYYVGVAGIECQAGTGGRGAGGTSSDSSGSHKGGKKKVRTSGSMKLLS